MTAADDGRSDEARGRLKRAAGARSGDRDFEREGTVDRGVAGVKQNVDRVADKVKGLLRSGD